MADGAPDTRTALLDAAETLVLERGFAGATVDAIVGEADLSKGAFFHHFSSKSELGRALLERESARELERAERLLERAEEVSGDPLIQVLITIALLEEELARDGQRPEGGAAISGSVRASLAAQGPEGRESARGASAALERRRELLAERLEAAARRHAVVGEVDARALAEMLEVILEGARLVERTTPEVAAGEAVARQLAGYREYLELLFSVSGPGMPEPAS